MSAIRLPFALVLLLALSACGKAGYDPRGLRHEETLLSVAISDALVIILRPDRQDYQGTAVAVEVARNLEVPNLFMLVNKALPSVDPQSLKDKVEAAYGAPVAGVFPLNEKMMELASGGVYCLEYPDDPFSQQLVRVAELIMSATNERE